MSRPENELKSKLTVVILCAGKGTRLNGNNDLPKSLIRLKVLNYSSILEHTINNLVKIGISQIVIVKGFHGQKIDGIVNSLKRKNSNLKEILKVVNASPLHELGPLYSFLSITKDDRAFMPDQNFVVIPGDTIFEFNLIEEIFHSILMNFKLIRENSLMFYREVKVKSIKINEINKTISIPEIGMKNNIQTLKFINQISLNDYSEDTIVRQIIPVIVYSHDIVQEMVELEKKKEIFSLREMNNLLIQAGKDIAIIHIKSIYSFFDIDYREDIDEFIKFKNRGKTEQ